MAKTHTTPPDMNTQAGRLRWARENAGYTSARGAAFGNGWNENTYKSHEQGIRRADGLLIHDATKYARAFGVAVDWLLTGKGAAIRDPKDQAWREMTDNDRELALRLVQAAGRKAG